MTQEASTVSIHQKSRRLPITWAIALAFTLATLVGILILTRDLGTSESIFRDGVAQAEQVDRTTDEALDGADQLPPANEAINDGLPEVVGVINSLNTANATLGTLARQLESLGSALDEADPSLVSIVGSAKTATVEANGAAGPAANIAKTLGATNGKIGTLGTKLDETQRLSDEIDSKLRIALLLPKLPRPGEG